MKNFLVTVIAIIFTIIIGFTAVFFMKESIKAGEWEAFAWVLSALIAVIGVGYTIKQKIDELSVKYVTDKRVDWIQDVRNTMSEYIALTKKLMHEIQEIKETPSADVFFPLDICVYKLKLFLNFKGNWDSEIIKVMEEIRKSKVFSCNNCKSTDIALFQKNIDDVTLKTQLYLKMEWERIKNEANGAYNEEEHINESNRVNKENGMIFSDPYK